MAIRNPLFDQGTIRLAQHTVNVIAGSDPRSLIIVMSQNLPLSSRTLIHNLPSIVMSQNPPIVIAGSDPRSPSCELLCELKMAGFLAQAGMGDPGSRPG